MSERFLADNGARRVLDFVEAERDFQRNGSESDKLEGSRPSSLIEIPCRAVRFSRPSPDWMASTPISIPEAVIAMPYKDPLVRLAYQQHYRENHREQRHSERPMHDRARHANRRAAMYGAPGRITVADVRSILHPGARCTYCGRTAEQLPRFRGRFALGIDHVNPLHAGGPNTVENIAPCCHSCNASKYRADRPWRWSRTREACIGCGTTERKHTARGYCNACYVQHFGNRASVHAKGNHIRANE